MTTSPSPATRPSFLDAIAVYLRPRVLIVMFLGFSAGLPLALSGSTLLIWMRESAVDLTTIGLFSLVGTPYTLKFLWAPIVDATDIPILSRLLGRRRSWLIFSQLLLIAAIGFLAFRDPAASPLLVAIGALLIATASATQDIVIDAFRIESLEEREQAAGMASYVAAYRIGMLVSTAGALFIVTAYEDFGLSKNAAWSWGYLSMALLVVIGMITALVATEPEKAQVSEADWKESQRQAENVRAAPLIVPWIAFAFAVKTGGELVTSFNLSSLLWWSDLQQLFEWLALWSAIGFVLWLLLFRLLARTKVAIAALSSFSDFLTRDSAILILVFVVFYKFCDAFAGAMIAPFVIDLGFSRNDYAAIVKGVGLVATLIGGFAGGYLARTHSLTTCLWIGAGLQMISNFVFTAQALIGQDYTVLFATIIAENFTGAIGTVVFVAYLSALCNSPLHTATQYALLTALAAIGRTYLSAPAGLIADFAGWSTFFIISAMVAIPSFILLAWLQARGHFAQFDKRP